MMSAVEFHDQTRLRANEIDDITINFVLSAEFPTETLPTTKAIPKQSFCIGHIPAQSSRELHMQTLHP